MTSSTARARRPGLEDLALGDVNDSRLHAVARMLDTGESAEVGSVDRLGWFGQDIAQPRAFIAARMRVIT